MLYKAFAVDHFPCYNESRFAGAEDYLHSVDTLLIIVVDEREKGEKRVSMYATDTVLIALNKGDILYV